MVTLSFSIVLTSGQAPNVGNNALILPTIKHNVKGIQKKNMTNLL